MDLEDIYKNNVSKSSVNMSGTGGLPVQRERDPALQKLENDVFTQMNIAAQPPGEAAPTPIQQPEIQEVDFTQALKELSDLSEPIDDKS